MGSSSLQELEQVPSVGKTIAQDITAELQG